SIATKGQGVARNVNTFGASILAEQLEIRSGAATYVKNPRTSGFEIPANFLKKTSQNSPAASEPPMTPLDLVHDRVGVLLHFLRQGAFDCIGSGGHQAT